MATMANRRMLWRFIGLAQEGYGKCTKPRDEALQHDDEGGPAASQFATNGGNGSHTRRVEQAEDQQSKDGHGSEDGGEGNFAKQGTQGADHRLLGHETADECRHDAPVAQSEGLEQRGNQACHLSQHRIVGIADHLHVEVESLKEPHHDAGQEDDREGPLQDSRALSHSSRNTFFANGKR